MRRPSTFLWEAPEVVEEGGGDLHPPLVDMVVEEQEEGRWWLDITWW